MADQSPVILASDATGTDGQGRAGLGVTYATGGNWDPLVVNWDLSDERSAFTEIQWKVAVQTSIKSNQHVNIHEAIGLIMATRVGLSHGLAGEKYMGVILVDNQAVVGAASKGRSSSSGLNSMLRRWAGLLLQRGWITPRLRYIPTDINPADRPSRAYRDDD